MTLPSPSSFRVSQDGQRLDAFLSTVTGRSRAFSQLHIEKGFVTINSAVSKKASHRLRLGDSVAIAVQEDERIDLKPVKADLDILFEDEDLIVINKPQGWVVHPAQGHRGETVVHYLLHYLKEESGFTALSPVRPGIVHRLDRGTSGCLLIAKNRSTLEALSKQFKERAVTKEYEALAWGRMPAEGIFRSSIGRSTTDRKKMSAKSHDAREAETQWKRIAQYAEMTHVALYPKTGRTHQLRVHLAESGHPIVGDILYGKRKAKVAADFPFLHARSLQFWHPMTGALVKFEAKRPRNFEGKLQELENSKREHS